MTEDQIRRLNEIGMEWGNRNHHKWSAAWEKSYEDAKAYFEENGDLKVPDGYRGASGKLLSSWILRQRSLRKDGKLPEAQVQMLDKIGMVWEIEDPWEAGYSHAEQFFKANGHLEMSNQYVCEDGYRLGSWLANQRTNHNNPKKYHYLTDEQTKQLERMGIVWRPSDSSWKIGFEHAKQYLAILNGWPWQPRYISPDGYKTGEWIRNQIRVWKHGGMKDDRRAMLQGIGLLPAETHIEAPKIAALPIGGKRNELQVESRS